MWFFIAIAGFSICANAEEHSFANTTVPIQQNIRQISQAEKQILIGKIDNSGKRAQRFYGESENIVKTAETSKNNFFGSAQLLAKQAENNLKALKLQDENNIKLADNKGVNLNKLLSKYYSKYQESKVEHELIPELMIFVSFSMPEASLKELGKQATKSGGVLVLRGMYNNSLTETFKRMQLLNEKGIPAIIHPGLFKKFNIKTVPAIALVDKESSYCLKSETQCTPIADLITGNVTLSHALSQFESNGDYKVKAKFYLEKIRGKA